MITIQMLDEKLMKPPLSEFFCITSIDFDKVMVYSRANFQQFHFFLVEIK